VGGSTTIQTDVRIIAATNQDLEAMVGEGRFRQDLYYRLSGFTLRLPALRERREDLPLLSDYFVQVFSRELDKPIRGVSDEVREILQRHTWPGNVRELISAIRYAIVHATGAVITPESLPQSCRGEYTPSPSLLLPIEQRERFADVRRVTRELLGDGSQQIYRAVLHFVDHVILEEVLRETNGNQAQAAERLGISRMTLRSKMRAARGLASDEDGVSPG
jgi:two-component system nitrogen regulation response regulator GlnG